MSSAKQGYFLIADITGYTAYLNESELEHAQHVLKTLLELLVAHTRPPLIIDRLAGDAVISYGLEDNFLSGQTFVEMIEDTYVAFRKAIELMVLNNTCRCSACANIANLDLKFFVHYGSFTIQELDRHNELLGPDVIVIHRLLKNHVTEATGLGAYTLYTDAAIKRLGIEAITETMLAHSEAYEHIGKINTWIQDMHPVWDKKQNEARITIAADDVLVYEEAEFPLPAEALWDIVSDPDYRATLLHTARQEVLNRQGGRIAPGSVYQCFHGDSRVTLQTILEWQPFEQMTTEDTTPVPHTTVLINIKLSPTNKGTLLAITCSKLRGPWLYRTIGNVAGRSAVQSQIGGGIRDLEARLAQELVEEKRALPEIATIPEDAIEQAAADSLSELSDGRQ
jgi:Protein of unknown function (DUF2652)